MGWWIFTAAAWLSGLLLVPLRLWRKLWLAGAIGMLVVFLIDNTLNSLQAFKYIFHGMNVSGIPVPYWVSYFPGGILFTYFRPDGHWKKALYILGSAFILWLLEYAMILLGYFQHINWKLANSYLLNVCGYIILLWLIEWVGFARKAKN